MAKKRVGKQLRERYYDISEVYDIEHPAVRDTFKWLHDSINILEDEVYDGDDEQLIVDDVTEVLDELEFLIAKASVLKRY